MQVFLPEPDIRSIRFLDPSRLGNQVYREAKTLISGGWAKHPAALIWRDHKHALALYALKGLEELRRRGRYYPIWTDYFAAHARLHPDTGLPPLVYNPQFCAAHRSQLLAKNPEWYGQFGWTEEPGAIPYLWR